MTPAEFQIVVFAAGKGSRMPEITAGLPKCLLPVGSRPLVWYPLQTIEAYGFKDAILVVTENQKAEIQSALEKTDLKIKIEYFTIAGNEDLGTADSLRLLHDKIHSDFICISCDLITDLDLHGAIDVFRKYNASVVSVFFNPQKLDCNCVPGPKAKHKPERDLIGIDAQTNRLVLLASASDYEENLTLKKSLLKKHSHIRIHSTLMDAHVYVMKNWICKYLQSETSFSTIKGELLPHIIKKQLLKQPKAPEERTASVVNTTVHSDIFQFAGENELEAVIRHSSTFNDHTGDCKAAFHEDTVRCYAHIAPDHKFGLRINHIPAYWNINSKIVELWPKVVAAEDLVMRDARAEINSNQVDDGCVIWEGAKLNEKTSFKSAIIGASCEIHSKTRVFNCVLMNNVVVKERCALQNCIVSNGAIIESGSNIKDCLIGANHTVPQDSEHSKEVLTDSDGLMEFE